MSMWFHLSPLVTFNTGLVSNYVLNTKWIHMDVGHGSSYWSPIK